MIELPENGIRHDTRALVSVLIFNNDMKGMKFF